MSAVKMGLVIRDPWYDFGTYPGLPNEPNRVFQDRMGVILADLGVRWVRFEFHADGPDFSQQIARNDYFLQVVAPRYGLRVLGLLGFGLVREQDPHALFREATFYDPVYGGGVNRYMRTWLERARFVAARYRGGIHAYEIMNEHNRLPPDGAAIPAALAARLQTKFYRFFRQVDRQAAGDQTWRDGVAILVGGLHPAGTGVYGQPGYITDLDYLYQTYASGAFVDYRRAYGRFPLDGLGYHPYPEEIRASLRRWPRSQTARWEARMLSYRLDEVREALADAGDPALPFWITEIGYNVGYGRHDEAGQAQFLEAVQGMLISRPDVAVSFWFKYEDFPPAEGRDAQKWGLVRIPFREGPCPGGACYDPEGRPERIRPAYQTYRALAQGS